MHLFFLNIVPHVWKDILVSPGMLNRIPGDEHVLDPGERLDACLARAFFPSHIGRMPPTVSQGVGTRPKAEQYQTLISVLPVILFEAFRVGDTIPAATVPRGDANTNHFKFQQHQARKLRALRLKEWVADGRRGLKPDLEDCMPSRDPGLYWAQVARLSIVVRILFSLQLSLSDASYATGILECFCCNFMRMNVHLVPSFHMALHVEETVAQFGALQNSWVWGFERANQSLTQTNKNGHRDGIMERTMMRRWWKAHGIFGLLQLLRDLPDQTEEDVSLIAEMESHIRGLENTRKRGTLPSLLARQAAMNNIDTLRMASVSAPFDLHQAGPRVYRMLLDAASQTWPDLQFYGDGFPVPGAIHIPRIGSTRSTSHLFYKGVRYGSAKKFRGKNSRYGYINTRQPVLIDTILTLTIVDYDGLERSAHFALVQRLCDPRTVPAFPWDLYAIELGIANWEYDELQPLELITVESFSGTFALFDIELSYGHYWISISLDHTQYEPEPQVL